MSMLGQIDVTTYDEDVNIAVGTVILEYTPYQARAIARDILAAADQAESVIKHRVLQRGGSIVSIMHARVARGRSGRLWLTTYLNGTYFPSWQFNPQLDPEHRHTVAPLLAQASAILERAGIEQLAPWEAATLAYGLDFRAA